MGASKLERAGLRGFRWGANGNQSPSINYFSAVFPGLVRDRPADSIDFVTADLARGRPNIGRAETWREFGSLRGPDFHEAGEGPQTGEHGNSAVIDFKSVET